MVIQLDIVMESASHNDVINGELLDNISIVIFNDALDEVANDPA